MKFVCFQKTVLLLLISSRLAEAQRVSGCAQYDLLPDQTIRCAVCISIYGLSQQFTCQLCAQSEVLLDGRCIMRQQLASGQPTSRNPALGNAGQTPRPPAEANSPEIILREEKSAQSQNILRTPRIELGKEPKRGPVSDVLAFNTKQKEPFENCFVFSGVQNICLKCEKQYELRDGVCYRQADETRADSAASVIDRTVTTAPRPRSPKRDTEGDSSALQEGPVKSRNNSFLQGPGQATSTLQFGNFTSTNPSSFVSFGQKPAGPRPQPVPEPSKTVHRYPQFPYCFDFADGRCWACIPGFVLNLIIEKCVKLEIKAPSILDTLESPMKDERASPISTNPDRFCNFYSKEKEECLECFRNYYVDPKLRRCLLADPVCRTFQQVGGQCTTCYQGYSPSSGKCLRD